MVQIILCYPSTAGGIFYAVVLFLLGFVTDPSHLFPTFPQKAPPMIRRYLTICLLFAAISLVPRMNDSADARSIQSSVQSQARSNAAIRRMPLLHRPNRPGHFIGNTIRRNHARRMRGGW